jgi:uroporphyrinogen decarboxylase
VPLLAFAGAPFTVASYLVEGRPSRTYQHTKRLMHTEPALWHAVMERLVQHSVAFIDAQLSAGARAFQVFDSWAGALSRTDYDRFVAPHSREVFGRLAELHPGTPGVHFGIGCDHLLEAMYAAAAHHPHSRPVLGLDWRTSIASARRRMGDDLVVQGNLDPSLVLAGAATALAGTDAVLADNLRADGTRHPGHIFNLGHGVQPDTDPGVLEAVVAHVHESTSR